MSGVKTGRVCVNNAVAIFFGWLLWRVTHHWELWIAGYLAYVMLAGIQWTIEVIGLALSGSSCPVDQKRGLEPKATSVPASSARPN